MKVVIVGGGKLGVYLAERMLSKKHDVELIEKDWERSSYLSEKLDIDIICGDGSSIETIAKSMLSKKADWLIAVTGNDQDNIVVSQLAKKRFKIKNVIARANNPKNIKIMHRLGIKDAVSSTEIVAKLIEKEIENIGVKLLGTLNKGEASICEFVISANSEMLGKKLSDISLPSSSLIVCIIREEKVIIPSGETEVLPKDEVVAICLDDTEKKLKRIFLGVEE